MFSTCTFNNLSSQEKRQAFCLTNNKIIEGNLYLGVLFGSFTHSWCGRHDCSLRNLICALKESFSDFIRQAHVAICQFSLENCGSLALPIQPTQHLLIDDVGTQFVWESLRKKESSVSNLCKPVIRRSRHY